MKNSLKVLLVSTVGCSIERGMGYEWDMGGSLDIKDERREEIGAAGEGGRVRIGIDLGHRQKRQWDRSREMQQL
jgi:hypothetical protein